MPVPKCSAALSPFFHTNHKLPSTNWPLSTKIVENTTWLFSSPEKGQFLRNMELVLCKKLRTKYTVCSWVSNIMKCWLSATYYLARVSFAHHCRLVACAKFVEKKIGNATTNMSIPQTSQLKTCLPSPNSTVLSESRRWKMWIQKKQCKRCVFNTNVRMCISKTQQRFFAELFLIN